MSGSTARAVPVRARILALLPTVLLAIAALRFARIYHANGMVPRVASFHSGWWNWTDQGRYYRAALAWAAGNLSPSAHWYPPLYPLLGAVFVPLHRVEPFLVPDIACFVATGWLVARIAGRLFPAESLAPTLGAAAFLVTDAISDRGLAAWIQPWTTTLATPLICGLLLGAIRLAERRTPGRAALCALLWGLLLMTRPTEAVWPALPAILFCAAATLNDRTPQRRPLSIALAATATAAGLVALDAAIHLSIFGRHLGNYYAESLGTGFEWRLIPIRFVSIVLNARPLHDASIGMATMFPWILPGLAGLLAFLVARGPSHPRHLLVGGAIAIHWVVFLSYRDLHPEGLWRFGNYHYFKWTEPFLALYAAMLVVALCRRRHLPALAAGIVATLALSAWRLSPQPLATGRDAAIVTGPHAAIVPHGLPRPDEALLLASPDGFGPIYDGPDLLHEAGRTLFYNGDVKAWPIDGGLAISVLRPVAPGPATIDFSPDTDLRNTPAPVLVAIRLRFGLPCFIASRRPACQLTRLR